MKVLLIVILIILFLLLKKKYESFTLSEDEKNNLIDILYKDDNIIRKLIHKEEKDDSYQNCNSKQDEASCNFNCVFENNKCISPKQKILNDFKKYSLAIKDVKTKKEKNYNTLKLLKDNYDNSKKKIEKIYFNKSKPNYNFIEEQKDFNNKLINFIDKHNISSSNLKNSNTNSNIRKMQSQYDNNNVLLYLRNVDILENEYIINFNNNYLKYNSTNKYDNIELQNITEPTNEQNLNDSFKFKIIRILNDDDLNFYMEDEDSLNEKIGPKYNLRYPLYIIHPNKSFKKILTIRNNNVSLEPINELNSIRNQTFDIIP